jgi:hypothetical protein
MIYTKLEQKIYSIQVELNQSGLIEIETIILNGLYRFSILGIKQKKSCDTRDRIYSALRSQKLINLKSDNKKITVNLLPTDLEKKTNIYDLSIALSCLCCMGQIKFNENILVVGELSILGNIISTGYLLKSIHQAIKNNIKIIICPQSDLEIVDKNNNDLYQLLKINNIKIITAESLDKLIYNIKNNIYYIVKNIENESNTDKNIMLIKSIEILDNDILKIVLGLCTKRNIFIENKKDYYVKKFINNLIYYNQKLNYKEILMTADKLDTSDKNILEIHTYPKASILDNQTQKKDLINMLNESIFGFNLIENFLNMNEESMYIIKKHHISSIICFYSACPCGNTNNFFNNINNERCFCIQRNILKYKQNVIKTENSFFDFHINSMGTQKNEYLSDDYININNIISGFRNTNLKVEENNVTKAFIEENIDLYERNYLDKVINLAKDICKLNNITHKKNLVLTPEEIELSMVLLKRDF